MDDVGPIMKESTPSPSLLLSPPLPPLVCMHAHMYKRGSQKLKLGVFLHHPPPYCFETKSLHGPGARLASQCVLGVHLSAFPVLRCRRCGVTGVLSLLFTCVLGIRSQGLRLT